MTVPKGRGIPANNGHSITGVARSMAPPHDRGDPVGPGRSAIRAANGSTVERGQLRLTDHSARWRVSGEPAAVAGARETASDVLQGWGLGAMADEAVLMLDELVTNAVLHGHGPIELRLRVDDDSGMLFGEVRDASDVLPTRREAAPDDEGGRGLTLITALAASHGWHRIDGGKAVWFTQPLPAPA